MATSRTLDLCLNPIVISFLPTEMEANMVIMSKLVFDAIGKYNHPTRYRLDRAKLL